MAQFEGYEENEGVAATRNPSRENPLRVKRINQATQLNTSDWTKFQFSQVNGLVVRKMAVGAEVRINDEEADSVEINPGDYFPGEINTLWIRNTETFPSSLDNEQLILWLNPSGQQTRSLAPLFKDIFQNRYNYADADDVNALIVELDTGLYGGSSFVEYWADIKTGYPDASTPKITIYSSVSPLEDGTTETGANGFRFMERWDYETERDDPDSPVMNAREYFHVVTNNAYRYVYLAIDFGEDGGSDLLGDCEIEITSTR